MTEDETGWSEKSRGSRSRGGSGDADGSASATPSRPSKRQDTPTEKSTIVRAPSDSTGSRLVSRAAATAGQGQGSFLQRFGFGALVALVCLLGVGAVFGAWTTREALATPRQNLDHWHSVYGVYDCTQSGTEKYLSPFQSADDATGIHSHGDGIMHVHPFFELSSGLNAQLRHWLGEMRVSVETDAIVLDTGQELVAGTECADQSGPAEIRILHWDFDFQALAGEAPTEVIYEDFGQIKFDNDREVYVIAFAAADTDVGLPPDDRFDTLNSVTSELGYSSEELPTELVPQDTDAQVEFEVDTDGDTDADGGTDSDAGEDG